jgi:hypothetical protein
MSINKLSGVTWTDISKVDGVTASDISKVVGVEVPVSFANTKSLFSDGVDDYFDITLPSDIIDHDNGTISFWINVDSSNTSTKLMFCIFDASQTTAGRLQILYFNTSGSTVFALNGFYRDETSDGVFAGRVCNAKTAASHHGKPFNRIASDYGDFGSPTDSIYNANLMKGNWHHVAFTWDTGSTYTYNSTTYNGVLKLYLDGVLVNEGVSTIPSNNSTGTATGLNGFDSGTVLDTIRIGAQFNANQSIDALIDEWSIFSSTLTDSDISDIYNSGAPADLSGYATLIGWWRFEDNTNDSSSNSNSGTLVNGATYNSSVPS